MAGTITHAYFARDVYNSFNKDKQNKFKNHVKDIMTYGQGHDILFFYYSINLKQGKFIRKSANVFHKKNTKLFFINMINYVKINNLQNDLNIMSYIYGYICHYSLDHIIHPYVTYKTGIFKSNKIETYKYNSKHNELETYIDCYMMKKIEKMDNKKVKFFNYCLKYHKPNKDFINFINFLFNKTYGVKNIGKYYFKSLNIMKILYRIMRYDPYKIKLILYKFIDMFLPKSCKKLYPISYAQTLNNNEYYLNLSNKKWNHPRDNKEIYYDSFYDLYKKAFDEASNIINAVDKVLYEDKNIKFLDNFFLNLSFTSGKDCNDTRKNYFFEY